eukprot:m51a1_g11797 hypothetical protein (486) ;mRNA; r:323601-325380
MTDEPCTAPVTSADHAGLDDQLAPGIPDEDAAEPKIEELKSAHNGARKLLDRVASRLSSVHRPGRVADIESSPPPTARTLEKRKKVWKWSGVIPPVVALASAAVCLLLVFLYAQPLLDPTKRLQSLRVAIEVADAGAAIQTGPQSYINVNIGGKCIVAQQIGAGSSTKDLFHWLIRDTNATLASLSEEVPKGTSYINPVTLVLNEGKQYTTSVVVKTAVTSIMSQISKAMRVQMYTGVTVGSLTVLPSKNATVGMLVDPVYLSVQTDCQLGHYGWYFLAYVSFVCEWIGLLVALNMVFISFHKKMSDSVHLRFWQLAGMRLGTILLSTFTVSLFTAIVVVCGYGHPSHHGFGSVFGTYWLTAMAFAAVMAMLFSWLSDLGLVVAIVVLVFQLVTCDGIYRRETLPAFFRALSEVFPMVHGVGLLRYNAYNVLPGAVGKHVGVLFAWTVGATVVAVLGWFYQSGERLMTRALPMYIEGFYYMSKTL